MKTPILVISLLLASPVQAMPEAAQQALAQFKAEATMPFSAERGQAFWQQTHNTEGESRSCSTCHGADLSQNGKHQRTGKLIEPMAPSVNPKRFSELKKIEKWFKRNCKWTVGRECSAQEKGDVLTYLGGL